MFRVLRCSNRRRERLTILRYTHTEEERSWKYCFANHIYFCSCFCSVLCSCLLLQPLSSFTCLLRCNDPEFEYLDILTQKKKEAENTVLQITFIFAPVFVQCYVLVYCFNPCLLSLVFFGVMILNFAFFGIWVRRSCHTSIQPYNFITAERLSTGYFH